MCDVVATSMKLWILECSSLQVTLGEIGGVHVKKQDI